MDLDHYLDGLRDDLAKATALSDEHTRHVAERLLVALEPALRLRLVEVLTDAAASLSADLGDTVEVRMEGRDPVWFVQRQVHEAVEPTLVLDESDADGTARITLRLPESVKRAAEAAAEDERVSLNSWIVTAVRAHLAVPGPRGRTHPRTRTERRITGWA